jgi:hypothetical protein
MFQLRCLISFVLPMLLLKAAVCDAQQKTQQQMPPPSHVSWVADVLKKMQTIKPGMTRADLLRVFTTEGGLSTGIRRTFVSRDCPYFKVDVEFRAVGRPDRDAQGRVTLREDARDIVTTVSRPYLAFIVLD